MVLAFSCGPIAAAATTRVEAVQWCHISPLWVSAQIIMDVQRYDQLEKRQYTSRYLLRIECSELAAPCRGMRLNVGTIESGRPVGLADLVIPMKMHLSSVQGKVAVVSWDNPFSDITLTIDTEKNIFEYHSSGKIGEARGVAPCAPLLNPGSALPQETFTAIPLQN